MLFYIDKLVRGIILVIFYVKKFCEKFLNNFSL